MQNTLTQDFERLAEVDRDELFENIKELDRLRGEIMDQENGRAKFLYVLQKGLIGVLNELTVEIRNLKHKGYQHLEAGEKAAEDQAADQLLDQIQ